jgi:hypothetical protein
MDNYAVWFNTYELTAAVNSSVQPPTHLQNWTGIATGNDNWMYLAPDPSPYILINDWSACGNLTWFGTVIAVPNANTTTDATIAQLSATVQQALASANATSQQVLSTCLANVSALASTVGNVQQQLSTLQANVSALASSNVNTLVANLTSVQQSLQMLQGSVNTLNSEITSPATSSSSDHGVAVAAIICGLFGFVAGLGGAVLALYINHKYRVGKV